jgi:hypothetical protein
MDLSLRLIPPIIVRGMDGWLIETTFLKGAEVNVQKC